MSRIQVPDSQTLLNGGSALGHSPKVQAAITRAASAESPIRASSSAIAINASAGTPVFDVCDDSLHVLELPGLDESSRDLGQRPLQEVCDVGGDSLRVLELPGSGACIRDAGQRSCPDASEAPRDMNRTGRRSATSPSAEPNYRSIC
jgi:hypothetical protein